MSFDPYKTQCFLSNACNSVYVKLFESVDGFIQKCKMFLSGDDDVGNEYIQLTSDNIAKLYSFLSSECFSEGEIPKIGENDFEVGTYREYEYFGGGISYAKNGSMPIWKNGDSLQFRGRGATSSVADNCVGIQNVSLKFNDIFEHTISSIVQIMMHEMIHTYDVKTFPQHYVDAMNAQTFYDSHGEWFVSAFHEKYKKYGKFDACSDRFSGKNRISKTAKSQYPTYNGDTWLDNEYICILKLDNGKKYVLRTMLRNSVEVKKFKDAIRSLYGREKNITIELHHGLYVVGMGSTPCAFDALRSTKLIASNVVDWDEVKRADPDFEKDIETDVTRRKTVIESSIAKTKEDKVRDLKRHLDVHARIDNPDIIFIV